MGRIIGYQYDDNVQDGDAWIGSEDGGGRTKQYTAEAVANYLNIQGKISIVGQMTYKYGVTPLSGPGTFAVFGGGTDPVAFSAITKLTLSNTDVSKQRVVEFLNLLVGSDILISKQSAISTFGYYSIDNYAVNATDPAYYDLGVTFKSGNGSMEAEQIYETQNFTLAAEENISTLQTTIDAGNTYASGTSLWQWDPGKISQVDPDEEWGLALSPEEGVIFTDGVGNSAGRSYLQATNLRIGNLTYTGSVFADNLTANRNFQLPNNSGTLALTTDITASPWDTVTGGINYANGNVGIGTTTPSAKLDVNGDALINGLTVGQGAGTSAFGNTVFGKTALDSITTGRRNVAIGNEALLDNTVGNHNIALGYRSLENNSASNNVAIGVEALQRVETAGNNTAVGRYALGLTSGAGNTAIGYAAGYLRVGGTNGGSINSVFIGSLTTSNGINPENEIVIGTGAVSAGSNTVVLGNDDIVSTRLKGDVIVANGNVGVGTTSPQAKLHIDQTSTTLGGAYVYSNAIHTGTSTNSLVSIRQDNVFSTGTVLDIRGDGTGDKLVVWDTTDVSLMVKDGGNVGIGTAAPGAKLQISTGEAYEVGSLSGSVMIAPSSVAFNGYGSGIVLGAGRGGLPNGGAAIASVLDSASDSDRSGLSFFYHDGSFSGPRTEGMRLNADGNVGIGTHTPQSKLHLATTGSSTLTIQNTTNSGNAALNFRDEGNNDQFQIYYALGANRSYNLVNGNGLTIYSSQSSSEIARFGNASSGYTDSYFTGNVGIGTTSPQQKLDVVGRVRASYDTSNYYEIGASSAGGFVVGKSGGVETVNIRTYGDSHFNGGNVGIGTASPGAKLDVSQTTTGIGAIIGNTTHNSQLQIYTAAAAKNSEIWFGDAADADVGKIDYDHSDNSLNFVVNAAERMRITSSGNIGIGTTSPYNKTHITTSVDGDGLLLDYSGGNDNKYVGVFFKIDNNTSDAYKKGALVWERTGGYNEGRFHFLLNNDDNASNVDLADSKVTILSTGDVGIGTTSPTHLLTLETASSPSLKIKDTTQGATLLAFSQDANSHIGTYSPHPLVFDTNSSEKMRITSSGNVGIGETNPSSKLEVRAETATHKLVSLNRAASPTAAMYLGNDSSNNAIISSNYSDLIFGRDQSSTLSEWMRIKRDGNVGIGTTSPSEKLHVVGNELIYGNLYLESTPSGFRQIAMNTSDGADNQSLYLCGGGTASPVRGAQVVVKGNEASSEGGSAIIQAGRVSTGDIIFKTGVTVGERMRIDEAGNVGIGTASPGAKLHISDDSVNQLYLERTGAITGKYRIGIAGATNRFHITDITQSSDRFVINENGNVGIGTTSPGEKLDVAGAASFAAASDGTNGLTFSRLSANNWRLNTSGVGEVYRISGNAVYYKQNLIVERGGLTVSPTLGSITPSTQTFKVRNQADTSDIFSVTDGGNVGIGTASPTSKLEVAGGDIELSDVAGGITMISPDGTRYRITVANGGTLTVTAV